MATTFHVVSLLVNLIIHTVSGTGCSTTCIECDNPSSCASSANRCTWEDAICQEITTANLDRFKIIPLPTISTTQTALVEGEECICNEAYFSSWINTEESCECYHGMKTLRVQYTGSTLLSSITFYHDTFRPYENCVFSNVEPNGIIQCTSFPYSQFVSNVIIKTHGIYECKASIDTTCTDNILNTVATDCNILTIVGWIDEEGYICKVNDSNGNRRRMGGSSSSSSASGSGRPWRHFWKKKVTTPSPHYSPVVPLYTTSLPTVEPTVYKETPSPTVLPTVFPTVKPTVQPTVKPTVEPTVYVVKTTPSPHSVRPLYTTLLPTQEPTVYDDDDETPSPITVRPTYTPSIQYTTQNAILTSSTMDSTFSQTDTPSITHTSLPIVYSTTSREDSPQTTILKEAYCECASMESWDDYHYLDGNGAVVALFRKGDRKANDVEVMKEKMVDDKGMMKDINADDMITNGVRSSCMHIVSVMLFVLCLMFI